jgi:SAM-dependent methyltransferase
MTRTYDRIDGSYARFRVPDPRLRAAILDAVGDAESVVNVGAGAGSYEPIDRRVVAIEPSATMVAQRPRGAAPCVRAIAEALPFADRAFDAALAVLTMHHWRDWRAGLVELRRVSIRRIVVFTWTPLAGAFWFVRDYLPSLYERDRARFPPLETFARAAGAAVEVRPVTIPWDCTDGFLGAYWRRPEAYLDPQRAVATSALAEPTPDVRNALARLTSDLSSGRWVERNGELRSREALDVGYRLLVVRY